MATVPQGFTVKRVDKIPIPVRSKPGKWLWLRQTVDNMEFGTTIEVVCPSKKDAHNAYQSLSNRWARAAFVDSKLTCRTAPKPDATDGEWCLYIEKKKIV